MNPCQPSPCGPNSQCRETNEQAVCSCLPEYVGSPPGCRPECVVSSECPSDKACLNQKCKDPCPGVCGTNAECRVNNHSPICSCRNGFTGNPFTRCNPIPRKSMPRDFIKRKNQQRLTNYISVNAAPQDTPISQPTNPCVPSPCGQNAQCQDRNGVPSCSCLPNYYGSPPNCRPECTINPDCPSNKACIRNKCIDPCPGSCGNNALCNVINHTPICTCIDGYTGDPFSNCRPIPPQRNYLTTSPSLSFSVSFEMNLLD